MITMSYILFYDTETTGLPLWDQPSEREDQPHIVQLAAQLVDADTRDVVQSINVIVNAARWHIPKEVSDIHGITTDLSLHVGVGEKAALDCFLDMWCPSKTLGADLNHLRVGHNQSFDARIIRIGLKRYYPDSEAIHDEWKNGTRDCTGFLMKNVMKMPWKGPGYKMPKLSEAYEFCFGKPLEGAHDAMVDVEACRDVYFWYKDNIGFEGGDSA